MNNQDRIAKIVESLENEIRMSVAAAMADKDEMSQQEMYESLVATGIAMAIDTHPNGFGPSDSEDPPSPIFGELDRTVEVLATAIQSEITLPPEILEEHNRLVRLKAEHLEKFQKVYLKSLKAVFNLEPEVITGEKEMDDFDLVLQGNVFGTSHPASFVGYVYHHNDPAMSCKCIAHLSAAGEKVKHTTDAAKKKILADFGTLPQAQVAFARHIVGQMRTIYRGGQKNHEINPDAAKTGMQEILASILNKGK